MTKCEDGDGLELSLRIKHRIMCHPAYYNYVTASFGPSTHLPMYSASVDASYMPRGAPGGWVRGWNTTDHNYPTTQIDYPPPADFVITSPGTSLSGTSLRNPHNLQTMRGPSFSTR